VSLHKDGVLIGKCCKTKLSQRENPDIIKFPSDFFGKEEINSMINTVALLVIVLSIHNT